MRSDTRPLTFDVTHLVSRLNRQATTGIDRVDLSYARHVAASGILACGLHYGLNRPHVFSPRLVKGLVARFEDKVGEDRPAAEDATFAALRDWLRGRGDLSWPRRAKQPSDQRWPALLVQSAYRIVHRPGASAPRKAIYLNVAQSGFEVPRFFQWLDRRPDVAAVFLVHDLLPLDRPEFFPDAYQARFRRRVDTITRHAKALITTTAVVRERVCAEYETRGLAPPPILTLHLPAPIGGRRGPDDADPELSEVPYFLHVATVEPRKNHRLLLEIWRNWPDGVPPKLVLVGARGWMCDQIFSDLQDVPALAKHVRHVSGLSRPALRVLLANARALLSPSFDEGYGLPLVEALTLGTPVIASDIPVYREVSGGHAEFADPRNAQQWRSIIGAYMAHDGEARRVASDRLVTFRAPRIDDYFERVQIFLRHL